MKRKIMVAMYCALTIFLLQGCQLAHENAGTEAYEDRMIGVFITTDYLDLFDFKGYLNDNLSRFSDGEIKMSKDTKRYQNRMYAVLTARTLTNEETGEYTETQEFVFEDIEGISYFAATMQATSIDKSSYISSTSDEAVNDGQMSIIEKNGGRTITLEGTIYVALTASNSIFYLNPVYQSADGSVYLTAGTGISAPMDAEGIKMSQSMDSTTTSTINGEIITDSLSVKVSIGVMSAPEKIVIMQMDANNTLLSITEYDPGKMPKELVPESNTEYLIVEIQKQSITGEKAVMREIYGRDADSIEYFILREDGICVKNWMQIKEVFNDNLH